MAIIYDDYLTEKKLGEFLESLYPKVAWIHDKIVPHSGIRNRPDYLSDELKLIVEFDGFKHYTDLSVILKDRHKDQVYADMGYRIIRIPYFIQLEPRTVKLLFNKEVDTPQIFPHGFIVENIISPAYFCYQGVLRYIDTLKQYPIDIQLEVHKSLTDRSEPETLKYPSIPEINEYIKQLERQL